MPKKIAIVQIIRATANWDYGISEDTCNFVLEGWK